jgi:uncharacterized protein (DUF169 family)
MESKIAQAIRAKFPPVAILLSDEKPEPATRFAEGKWGCLMWLLAGAVKGTTAAVDERRFGCLGGGTGLGFGNQYEAWPGGIECFYDFLSMGIAGRGTAGGELAEKVRPRLRRQSFEHLVHGERYVKSPEVARRFVESLPTTRIPTRYVILKPLSQVDPEEEEPNSVLFLVNPNRLSALVVLANYEGPAGQNVIVPSAAGCQSFGIFTFREARSERPRAVIGMVDISARRYMNRQFGSDLLTFSIPFRMFLTMEANVPGSFLERDQWKEVLDIEAASEPPVAVGKLR